VSPLRRSGGEWLGVLLHIAFTALGCAVSLGLVGLIYGLLTLPHPDPYGSATIFNPLFWVPSFFLGLLINRLVHHSWAWLAPATIGTSIMIGVILWDVSLFRHSAYEIGLAHGHLWRYEFERLFWPVSSLSPEKEDRSLAQLFLTFPFLSSVAYTVGAWLASRSGKGVPLPATTATK
jgi:hypothetical protein